MLWFVFLFFLMIRRPPRSTRTDTLFPDTTLFRSVGMLLAASTGIVGATVVTMGLLSLPSMLKAGYDPRIACGTICASGTQGQIIPPSIVLVLLGDRSEEHTSELQSLMRISYAVFCLKKKKHTPSTDTNSSAY